MMKLESIFKFWSVGQGGFYTGRFKLQEKYSFNIVFDCGTNSSEKYLNNSIASYKNDINDEFIDILFLSHLHKDHVSGLPKLLKDKECKYVVMPYFTKVERLYLGLCYLRDNPSAVLDGDYLKFLQDPVVFISEKSLNVENIIFIKGNSNKELNEPKDIEDSESDFKIENNLDDAGEKFESFGNSKINVSFKKGGGSLVLQKKWEFRILHVEYVQKILELFKESVSNMMGAHFDFSFLGLNEKISELKLLLPLEGENKIDINDNGIAVLHFPLFKQKMISSANRNGHVINTGDWCFPCYFKFYDKSKNKAATLLTGDIRLSKFKNFSEINNELVNIKFFQIPHHGSSTGWDDDFFSYAVTSNKYLETIIQHGFKRESHPNNAVLDNLKKHKVHFSLVNEYQEFTYIIKQF